jgi:hypothetical protein
MSPEAIVLAVVNAGRPTSIAMVYALLGAAGPRRVLSAYLAVGFAWSVAVGIVIVAAVHGVDVSRDSTAFAIVDLIGGVAILGFAVGYLRGTVASGSTGPRIPDRLHDPPVALAAGAGVATHLPGLFYLLGLNAIAAQDPDFVDAVIRVLIFNAIWWIVPIASLALAIRRPEDARRLLARVNSFAREHERPLVLTVAILVGAFFTVKGAIGVAG